MATHSLTFIPWEWPHYCEWKTIEWGSLHPSRFPLGKHVSNWTTLLIANISILKKISPMTSKTQYLQFKRMNGRWCQNFHSTSIKSAMEIQMITAFQILYYWMLCIGRIPLVTSGYFWGSLGLFLAGWWNFYFLRVLGLYTACPLAPPSNFWILCIIPTIFFLIEGWNFSKNISFISSKGPKTLISILEKKKNK